MYVLTISPHLTIRYLQDPSYENDYDQVEYSNVFMKHAIPGYRSEECPPRIYEMTLIPDMVPREVWTVLEETNKYGLLWAYKKKINVPMQQPWLGLVIDPGPKNALKLWEEIDDSIVGKSWYPTNLKLCKSRTEEVHRTAPNRS